MDIESHINVPQRFAQFGCSEYFGSPGFRSGVFIPAAQLQVVYPESQLRLACGNSFLVIGSAGADGIEFGYRQEREGLWAFHPSESRFQFVASSVQQLVVGYRSGAITV